jgi:hypothetical protein
MVTRSRSCECCPRAYLQLTDHRRLNRLLIRQAFNRELLSKVLRRVRRAKYGCSITILDFKAAAQAAHCRRFVTQALPSRPARTPDPLPAAHIASPNMLE